MNASCLFCRIIAGELPAEIVAENETAIAIRDIAPRAPVHVLTIPRDHVRSIHDIGPDQRSILEGCLALAREVVVQEGIEDGYRLATNVGAAGGQTVFHLHVHVLGGRQLGHIDSLG
jgi:histidine triad (HIT) family protein